MSSETFVVLDVFKTRLLAIFYLFRYVQLWVSVEFVWETWDGRRPVDFTTDSNLFSRVFVASPGPIGTWAVENVCKRIPRFARVRQRPKEETVSRFQRPTSLIVFYRASDVLLFTVTRKKNTIKNILPSLARLILWTPLPGRSLYRLFTSYYFRPYE